ncbi:MAG: HD domain-containing protein [Syntrophales bacterium]
MNAVAKTGHKPSALSAAIKEIIQESKADMAHAKNTREMALLLFNSLACIHKMSPRKRLLLEVSAMLHDIGWARTTNGAHHKHSRDMILQAKLPEITGKERRLCALIARYHNKAEPNASKHRQFAALKSSKRFIVLWGAAILRVADGLDCNHNGKVHVSGCRIGKTTLTILIDVQGSCPGEIRRAKRKGELLSRMADRELEFLKDS